MSVYVVANIHVTDEAVYARYRELHAPILAQFGGKFVARTTQVRSLEGVWPTDRIVIIEFPSKESALRWWSSAEYAPVKQLRTSATATRMILVEGVG